MTRIKITAPFLKAIGQLVVFVATLVPETIRDIRQGKFMKNKWDKHAALGLLLGGLIQFGLGYTYDGLAVWTQYLFSGGLLLFLCLPWELIQGHLGANRGAAAWREACKDIVVGVAAGLAGVTALIYI